MTELEAGHFADGEKVVSGRRQRASEQILLAHLQGYVEVAHSYAPTGSWLDIGCGAGGLLRAASKRGYEVEGIELTRDRRVVAQEVSGSTIYAEPVEDIQFGDDSFDVISLINVFSHLTGPAATLCELARILKPDGVIICVTGELGDEVRRRHMFSWGLGDHLYFLGLGTMARYAEKSGLCVSARSTTWLPATLYTKERFLTPGRSNARNVLKQVLARTPLALAVLRKVMLRREAGNAVYVARYVLTVTR